MTLLADEAPRWESGLVAALIAAAVVLIGYWWNTRLTRIDRQRQLFAEAFGAVMEYREYPFIVRRRSSDIDREPITTGLSTVQASLNKYSALLRIESRTVGVHYGQLVAETRRVAGAAVSAGWELPVREAGTQMHLGDIDLSGLDPFDEAFVVAVKHHLGVLPSWAYGRIMAPAPTPSGGKPANSGRSTSSR